MKLLDDPTTRFPAYAEGDARQALSWALRLFGERIVLASSLGPQSLVVLDLCERLRLDLRVVFLDTGLHFAETLEFLGRVEARFALSIERVDHPEFDRSTTYAFLMSVRKLERLTSSLVQNGFPGELPARLVCDASLETQRTVDAPLSSIASEVRRAGLEPPGVLLVGAVVAALEADAKAEEVPA